MEIFFHNNLSYFYFVVVYLGRRMGGCYFKQANQEGVTISISLSFQSRHPSVLLKMHTDR